MVVFDESKEQFILNIPNREEDFTTVRHEERKRTGRYLAISCVLFIIALGLYHAISNKSTKVSALLGATMTMFLYILWLIYASQKKKEVLKKNEEHMERHVTTILENMNNIKARSTINNQDNLLIDHKHQNKQIKIMKKKQMKNENNQVNEVTAKEFKVEAAVENCKENINLDVNNSNKVNYVLVRTYSIA